jgi:hypothetical protein
LRHFVESHEHSSGFPFTVVGIGMALIRTLLPEPFTDANTRSRRPPKGSVCARMHGAFQVQPQLQIMESDDPRRR